MVLKPKRLELLLDDDRTTEMHLILKLDSQNSWAGQEPVFVNFYRPVMTGIYNSNEKANILDATSLLQVD